MASRLSDADPELSILVLESGPDNHNEPGIVHPGLFLGNLLPTSKNNTFHMAKASKDIAERRLPVPAGRVLGGGSSINTMAYARGQVSDYDSWDTPGWSTEELRPYLNKVPHELLNPWTGANMLSSKHTKATAYESIMAQMVQSMYLKVRTGTPKPWMTF